MKIRNGFVTNSSSSSFILQFDTAPKTLEDVRKIFFPKNSLDDDIADKYEWSSQKYNVKYLCETILSDLKTPLTFDEMYDQEGLAYEIMTFGDWLENNIGISQFILWEEARATGNDSHEQKLEKEFYEAMKSKIVKMFKNKGLSIDNNFYVVEYEDHGNESILEYGEILEVQGIRISRH